MDESEIEELNRSLGHYQFKSVVESENPPSIEELEQKHQELISSLRAFDRDHTLKLVAGLLTFPSFHANTMRIEFLLHMVYRHAAGLNKPTRNRLSSWLNADLVPSWPQEMEDPVEDVFISNVITGRGNNRIFEGIWEAQGFWCQEALKGLKRFARDNDVQDIFDSTAALLGLSELLVARCDLPRYTMGGGKEKGNLDLPTLGDLRKRADRLIFTDDDLRNAGISIQNLEPFVHCQVPIEGAFRSSTLEAKPVLRAKEGLLVALPSTIGRAICRYVVEELEQKHLLSLFEKNLVEIQVGDAFELGLQLLGAEPSDIKLPDLPPNTSGLEQIIVNIDKGKWAHVIFVHDPLAEKHQSRSGGVLNLLEKEPALVGHCEECANLISARPEFSGGMTIAIVGGFGGSIMFGVNSAPTNWHIQMFGLSDWLTLGRIAENDLLSVWTILQKQSELAKRGIHIANFNGTLNLLAFHIAQGERLVPLHAPGRDIGLIIPTDEIAKLRQTIHLDYDFHAIARRNPDGWVPVRRHSTAVYFKEVIRQPIYIDEDSTAKGLLRGSVETSKRSWWVSSIKQYSLGWHNHICLKVWEALLNWTHRIASVAEDAIFSLPDGPIEVFMWFDGIDNWTSLQLEDLPARQSIKIAIEQNMASIRLIIPLGFLSLFAEPTNIAERQLVWSCLAGLLALSGESATDPEIAELLNKIITSDDARFFHIVPRRDSYRHQFDISARTKQRFIKQGEIHSNYVGLSQRILGETKYKLETVEGKKECQAFLHAVVDDCWHRMEERLRSVSRDSVVRMALENVESLEFDRETWELTAKALLAIHQNHADVIMAASKRDQMRAEAELSSRCIVEMSICTSPVSNVRECNHAIFDELLGNMKVLLNAAYASDAINYDFVSPKVVIIPNGEFAINQAYRDAVIEPYVKEHFTRSFHMAAADYGARFEAVRKGTASMRADGKDDFEDDFIEAFEAEYGMPPKAALLAQWEIQKDALIESKYVVSRTKSELLRILADGGLSDDQALSFLLHFSLYPRMKWTEVPVGYTNKDWYPWRFRRRLSVVSRPFIKIDDEENSTFVFAPGLVDASFKILFYRLMEGHLPPEYFRSTLMRSWIGHVTRQNGMEFEEIVASELASVGLETICQRPMTEFGADESYGDLDVMAWFPDGKTVYAIECKRLRLASTVAEVGEQLREFKGEELDRLSRHLRRCDWLEGNRSKWSRIIRKLDSGFRVCPLLVTSTVVPMQFVSDLPIASHSIVPINSIPDWAKRVSGSA